MTTMPTPPLISDETTARDEAKAHLLFLFRGGLLAGEWYELRCLDFSVSPARPGPRLYFRSITELAAAAIVHREQFDVFFGVALRRCPSTANIRDCQHRPQGRDHLSRLPAAWGDFDLTPDEADQAGLLERLGASPVPPALLLSSGRGIHAYWPVEDPTASLGRIEGVNRGIRDRLGADNAVDAARILRVAGTINHKYGRPLPVRILETPHAAS